jgi:hypothetical protein
MIHTAKSFAALLNGRQYLEELTKEEEVIAKENNLIVCFGQGDDLLKFRGAIYDELNVWTGTGTGTGTYIINGKAIDVGRYEEDLAVLVRYGYTTKPSIKVISEWCPDDFEGLWLIQVEGVEGFSFDILENFDILEDEDLYCRGIVFTLN